MGVFRVVKDRVPIHTKSYLISEHLSMSDAFPHSTRGIALISQLFLSQHQIDDPTAANVEPSFIRREQVERFFGFTDQNTSRMVEVQRGRLLGDGVEEFEGLCANESNGFA